MKYRSSGGILASLVFLLFFASSAAVKAQDPQERFKPELLVEDFKLARHALEEGHSGIYRYTTKARPGMN